MTSSASFPRARRALPLAGALCALLAWAAPSGAAAASLPAGTTAVVSGTPDLTAQLATPVSDSFAGPQAVSRDGTRVVFDSGADGLLDGDDDVLGGVYVKDLTTGAVQLVSRANDGSPAACSDPAISADGTKVAMLCFAALDPADTNNTVDVYERDLVAQQTILVSRASGANGVVGNGSSDSPAISAGGEFVAFRTEATNLGGGVPQTPVVRRIYRRRVAGGAQETRLITPVTDAAGTSPVEVLDPPSISDDGQRIAYNTAATLSPGEASSQDDVFVFDAGTGTTQLASRASGAAGAGGKTPSERPVISGDGRFVAFTSSADNLAPSAPSPGPGVYRRQLDAPFATSLIGRLPTGQAISGRAAAINRDGTAVAFLSEAVGADPGDTSRGQDVYVDRLGQVELASRRDGPNGVAADNAVSAALSGDGAKVVVSTSPNETPGTSGSLTDDVASRVATVSLRDLNAKTTTTISRPPGGAPFLNDGGRSGSGTPSADGRYVAFVTDAPAFGVPTNVETAVVLRDTVTGAVTLVSREDGPDGAPMHRAEDPVISADGTRVAFTVSFSDGTPSRVYVRDIPSGRTFRVDRADGPGSPVADDISREPSISADGTRVAFESRATNLGDGDTDRFFDVHVRDIERSRTLLVSRADGPAGAKGTGHAFAPAISADGHDVAFETVSRLASGDTDDKSDVYVRDIDASTTRLVSTTPAGVKGNDTSEKPSISGDGRRVSFISAATNLGDAAAGSKLYVRDLADGSLTRADVREGAPATPGPSVNLLSADGQHVVFSALTDRSTLRIESFERDLASGVTRLISRRSGADGDVPLRGQFTASGVTADGACVVFSGFGLLPPPASPDFGQVYMRAVAPDCGRPSAPVGGNGGGGGTGIPGSVDRTAPRLSQVRLSRTRFRVAKAPTALAAAVGRGTVLRLRLSEAARLTITVDRARKGRRASRTAPCRPTAKHVRRGACTAYSRDGRLTRGLKPGAARIAFSGRLGRKALRVGTHRLTLVARDAAGNASKPVTLKITVVR